jgi:hypothetical protein
VPLLVKSWNLCEYQRALDGQWQGSLVASDGNCYFASSTHGGRTGAMFFKFDPRAQQITPLCKDLTVICGEDPARHKPQGKVHSDIAEMDGWLYFGTHLSYYYSKPAGQYTGSHLVGFEMATGTFRDFGVIHPEYTNYSGLAGDPRNKRVYMYVVDPQETSGKPSYLYRINLPEGTKRKVGELPAGGFASSVAHMFVDRDGNCWFAVKGGRLAKYDPLKDKTELMEGAAGAGPRGTSLHMRWVQAMPGKNLAAASMDGGAKVGIFDPAAKADRFRAVAETGGGNSAAVLAGDVVYFVQAEDGKAQGSSPKRLKAVNLAAAAPGVVDYGRIADQDGRTPMRIPSLAADAEGRVYMTGDWFTKPGDVATTRLTRDAKGNESYPAQNRSQRFAFVKVAPPGR